MSARRRWRRALHTAARYSSRTSLVTSRRIHCEWQSLSSGYKVPNVDRSAAVFSRCCHVLHTQGTLEARATMSLGPNYETLTGSNPVPHTSQTQSRWRQILLRAHVDTD